MEIGTLAELNVKPGDVVACDWVEDFGFYGTDLHHPYEVMIYDDMMKWCGIKSDHWHKLKGSFRIISRASDTPKTWGEMTDEEKGALLLAAHDGKVIECIGGGRDFWLSCEPQWKAEWSYRIKTEPKRETVTFLGCAERGFDWSGWGDETTHRITFDMIDGNPACDSIRMSKL